MVFYRRKNDRTSKKYGRLTVLDLGEEYAKSEKYMSLLAEELLKNEIKKIKEKRDLDTWR